MKKTIHTAAFILAGFAATGLASFTAKAQEQGYTSVQGKIIGETSKGETLAPIGPSVDHREQMRDLVTKIGTFARKYNRNFKVTAMDTADLLTKTGGADDTKSLPARAYMSSIDGVFQEGLNFGVNGVNHPTDPEVHKRLLDAMNVAKQNGLPVFIIDYANKPKDISEAYRDNARAGFVSYVAPQKGDELNELAKYPKRPVDENAGNILSLNQVKNFVYLRDPSRYGRQDQFSLMMHNNNYDLVIVDVFDGREPLSRRAIETLKYKKTGAKRLVFAYIDIGTAASYHYYWKPNWTVGNPSWITQATPNNPDKYYVEYWNPAWQKILFGGTDSYVYGVIKQGYDGVLIDGLTAASYFAAGAESDLTSSTTGFIR